MLVHLAITPLHYSKLWTFNRNAWCSDILWQGSSHLHYDHLNMAKGTLPANNRQHHGFVSYYLVGREMNQYVVRWLEIFL